MLIIKIMEYAYRDLQMYFLSLSYLILWSHNLMDIWLQETNGNLLAEKKVKVVFVLGGHFGFFQQLILLSKAFVRKLHNTFFT